MMIIPCKDCITLPICKAFAIEKYENYDLIAITELEHKCRILDIVTHKGLETPNDYDRYCKRQGMVMKFLIAPERWGDDI